MSARAGLASNGSVRIQGCVGGRGAREGWARRWEMVEKVGKGMIQRGR